jgi:hypothetical protein
MSNSVKAKFAFVVMIAVLVGCVLIYTFPHWWLRAGTAEVRNPAGHVYQANVYRSTQGDLLFVIQEDSLADEYIFYPSTGQIGMPSIDQFYIFSLFAYSKDVPAPVVLSTDKIKVDMDIDLVVDGKHIEFTTRWGFRVKADTNKFN